MVINPKLNKRVQELINSNIVNINVADFLNTAFNYTDIFNADEIKQYIKEGLNEKEAMMEILTRAFEIDYEQEENKKIMDSYILDNLKKLNPNEYLNIIGTERIVARGLAIFLPAISGAEP